MIDRCSVRHGGILGDGSDLGAGWVPTGN
jgi:hypothetical protein